VPGSRLPLPITAPGRPARRRAGACVQDELAHVFHSLQPVAGQVIAVLVIGQQGRATHMRSAAQPPGAIEVVGAGHAVGQGHGLRAPGGVVGVFRHPVLPVCDRPEAVQFVIGVLHHFPVRIGQPCAVALA